MTEGRLFAVVGPSGAGKDTLLAALPAIRPDIWIVRRVITRPAAPGDEPFESVTEAEFAVRLAAGAFALHWQAHGLNYGIPASISDVLAAGRDVVFNGSRAALPVAMARFPGLRVVLVTAPDAVLAARLAGRGREGLAEIGARLRRAGFEMPPGIVPIVVTNDGTPEDGARRLAAALQAPRG